ncbi:unnamed protein product, partial [Brassica napus]
MRPPPDCRPSVGASPQRHVSLAKSVRWKRRSTALNYNYHRVAGRILSDDLNMRRGIVSGRVALLPRS